MVQLTKCVKLLVVIARIELCKGGKGYGYDYEKCPRKLSLIDPNVDLQIPWIYVFCSTSP